MLYRGFGVVGQHVEAIATWAERNLETNLGFHINLISRQGRHRRVGSVAVTLVVYLLMSDPVVLVLLQAANRSSPAVQETRQAIT